MKHLITTLTFLLLFFCTSLMAQEMSVKSFEEATTDLAARTKARQDLNGNDCALVKVLLEDVGVTFSGNVMGDVAFTGNEYWVYMSEGTKRLKVVHPSYLPLEVRFADYGITSLHGKTTYVLTLQLGEIAQGKQEPKVQTGWIIIKSEPSGASVYINDEFVGNTPLTNYKTAYGTYSCRLEYPDYRATTTIELNSGRIEKTITLLHTIGAISVTSNVNGAKVTLDGNDTGNTTPCTIQEVVSGEHTVTVSKDGYYQETVSVHVSDNETTVTISLKGICPDGNHPHMIDLGLPSGTKWACCNVDASNPEDDGGYYAWGETTTKSNYTDGTYKYNNRDIGESICGTQYDVAHVKWDGSWQMPSLDQIKELCENCTYTWTTVNGVKGGKFTGPNGGSIFLSASGVRNGTELDYRGKNGLYWSGSQFTSYDNYAYLLFFVSDLADRSNNVRWVGYTVRPVAK